MRRHRKSNRLGLEQLETRELLAGNVTAKVRNDLGAVNANSLVITGDASNNSLVFTRGSVARDVIVSGAKDAAGNPTTVNGQLTPVTMHNVYQIKMALGAGNDTVVITNLVLDDPPGVARGNIAIGCGAGNDRVIITSTGPTDVVKNSGAAITYNNVNIDEGIRVQGEDGNDALVLSNVTAGVVTFQGDTNFTGSVGNDRFIIDGAFARNNFRVAVEAQMDNGNDLISIKHANIGNGLSLAAGGTSQITLDDVQVKNDISIFGNHTTLNISGNLEKGRRFSSTGTLAIDVQDSTINVTYAAVKELKIANETAGSGNRNVTITNLLADVIFAVLGSGDDTLSISKTTTTTSTTVDGGAGTDTYHDLGGNSLANLTISNFE